MLTAPREGQPGKFELKRAAGCKKTDFLWRGSRWSLEPHPGFWARELTEAEVSNLCLPEGTRVYRIQWINTGKNEGGERRGPVCAKGS